jgi:hypothetical protein
MLPETSSAKDAEVWEQLVFIDAAHSSIEWLQQHSRWFSL